MCGESCLRSHRCSDRGFYLWCALQAHQTSVSGRGGRRGATGDPAGHDIGRAQQRPYGFLAGKRQVGRLGLVTLTGDGLADSYETCSCTLGPYGPAPNFQCAVRAGLLNRRIVLEGRCTA